MPSTFYYLSLLWYITILICINKLVGLVQDLMQVIFSQFVFAFTYATTFELWYSKSADYTFYANCKIISLCYIQIILITIVQNRNCSSRFFHNPKKLEKIKNFWWFSTIFWRLKVFGAELAKHFSTIEAKMALKR